MTINKHFAKLSPYLGGKTAHIDMVYEEITSMWPYEYALINTITFVCQN